MPKNKSLLAFFYVYLLVLIAVFSPIEAHATVDGSVKDFFENAPSSDDKNTSQDEPDAGVNEKATASASFSLLDFLKVLLAFVLVIALLIVVLKLLNKRNVNYQQNSVVRNIGGISVGAQKSVQILQVGKHLYMVGVGENVQLLKEIVDEQEIEQLLSQYGEKQSIPSAVPYIVEMVKGKATRKKGENKQEQNFGTIFDEKLTQLKKERRNGLEQWKEKEHDKQ